MRSRGTSVVAALCAVVLLATACTSGGDDKSSTQGDGGGKRGAPVEGFEQRAHAYLARAERTKVPADAGRDHVWRAVAQLAADPDGAGAADLTVDDLSVVTKRIEGFVDTTDFDMIALVNLWYRSDHGRRLAPATRAQVRKLILEFKYWYDEPQPPGTSDQRWYWSENHQILYHAIELLAGEAFPTETFTNSGTTGAEHVAHARPLIVRWVTERARWGFSEWYSNVYYEEDLEATVALADLAGDHDVATLGAIATDLLLYDLASHTHAGAFGATHGRSYKKDKMTALDEDTWDVSKLVLDDAAEPYQSTLGAVYMAAATRYRPPAVLGKIVHDNGPAPKPGDPGGVVEKARHSLPIDPLAPVTPNPPGPEGLAFDDHDNLMTWWGMGALTPWQTVVESTAEMTKYDLWSNELFSDFKPFEGLVKAASPDTIRALAHSLAPQLNLGLLSEANTYTWRSGGAMLSTAQDFRKGQASQQHHIWQATFSPDAQVFTTHPRTPTEPGVSWHSNTDDWTGSASLPRSAQVRNVNISIYAPLYPSDKELRGGYMPYTHAYLPQDAFDEVTSEGNWTFARHGDDYLALWSWRTPHWVTYDPAKVDTNGLKKPFELVADGGPNDVWITEIGSKRADGSFADFRAAIAAHEPKVTPLGDPATYSTAFDVEWTSPTQGPITFGWDRPLTADGAEQPLSGYPRIDSPWAQVPFDSTTYDIAAGGETLHLDVTKPARRASASL
jgi:hypothetical protein